MNGVEWALTILKLVEVIALGVIIVVGIRYTRAVKRAREEVERYLDFLKLASPAKKKEPSDDRFPH